MQSVQPPIPDDSDKTTLSYAAIFKIQKGLHLKAEEYVSDV